eukprot:TRINITY_DN101642_c0_g1_i1.p1 TRINITY_DN101642_c0_g1~~TRINITY_DN101642_c0_g1_i1.p1  ORF type:complete len:798 (+),score=175.49 TRINITY_DN101642_c0_g1_i1:123-2516(+)
MNRLRGALQNATAANATAAPVSPSGSSAVAPSSYASSAAGLDAGRSQPAPPSYGQPAPSPYGQPSSAGLSAPSAAAGPGGQSYGQPLGGAGLKGGGVLAEQPRALHAEVKDYWVLASAVALVLPAIFCGAGLEAIELLSSLPSTALAAAAPESAAGQEERAREVSNEGLIGVFLLRWGTGASFALLAYVWCMLLHFSNLEFGWSEVAFELRPLSMVIGVLTFVVPSGLMASPLDLQPLHVALLQVAGVGLFVYGTAFLRGPSLFPGILLLAYPVYMSRTEQVNLALGVIVLLLFIICTYLKYVRDQRLLFLSGLLVVSSLGLGAIVVQIGPYETLDLWYASPFVLLLLLAYGFTLFARRQRSLPLQLRPVKFVRHGFLRSMRDNGIRLCRQQELPAEAFGDVTKAEVLVVISHRWLGKDRFTCDVHEADDTEGLRFSSVMRRLGQHYPSRWQDMDQDLASRFRPSIFTKVWRLIRSCHAGGHDVLVFFDFMSLPQVGKAPSGAELPRTPQENAVFTEALPAMAALYSVFPVLVVPDVRPQETSYFEGGWCFAEFALAVLNGTHVQFSQEIAEEFSLSGAAIERSNSWQAMLAGERSQSLDAAAREEFEKAFEQSLHDKYFRVESDRKVVREMGRSSFLQRALLDAIQKQDAALVRRVLDLVQEQHLAHVVNFALDETLDTVLHVASRLSAVDIVLQLLNFGADPDCRNLRGDTPSQLLLIPRVVTQLWWGSSLLEQLHRPTAGEVSSYSWSTALQARGSPLRVAPGQAAVGIPSASSFGSQAGEDRALLGGSHYYNR